MPRGYRLGAPRPELKFTTATKGKGVVLGIEDDDKVWIELLPPRAGRIWFSIRDAFVGATPPRVGDTIAYAQIADTVRKAGLS
jgi:hypothetical protein